MQDFADNILAISAVFGVVALIFSNFIRHLQSKNFGVPFKIIYHSIYDYIDILVLTLVVLGISALSFILIFSSNRIIEHFNSAIYWTMILGFAILCGIMLFLSSTNPIIHKKKLYRLSLLTLCLSLILFVSSLIVHFLRIDPPFIVSLSILILSLLLLNSFLFATVIWPMMCKVKGVIGTNKNGGNYMTTIDEENLYLVALRYNSKEWILLPCKELDDSLYFEKGKFIIRNLNTSEIYHKKYVCVLCLDNETHS